MTAVTTKVKVLVISNYDDAWNVVRPEGELFIGLQQRGDFDITVMTPATAPYADRFSDHGIRVIDFRFTSKFDRENTQRLRRELVEGQYDILHLFYNKAVANGVRAAAGLPVRVLVYRGYTGNIYWWDPTVYLTYLHRRIDLITCVSPAVKATFDHQPVFPSEKAIVVSKGHDPAWYADIEPADLSEFGLPPGSLVFTIVANARRMKGIEYLVEAIGRLRPDLPIAFLFIGKGLKKVKAVKKLERTAYANRIVFTGFRTDALQLVRAADASLLPSVKGEGLSKVLLEAFFLGKPVIMTDIAGNRGVGIAEQTALVVPPKKPAALTQAIERLATDAQLRARLGAAGRAHVAEHYSVARSVGEMANAYHHILGHQETTDSK